MDLKSAASLHRSGRWEEAEQAYRQVLLAQPASAPALQMLGVLVAERGRPTEAVELLRRSVELAPASPQYKLNLAAIMGRMGRHAEAAEVLRTALVQRPGYADGHNNLGVALEHLGKSDEAAAAYRQAIALRPDYAEAFLNLGNTLRKSGQYAEAEENYRRAIELRPADQRAYEGMGSVATERGDAAAAIECYRNAAAAVPASAGTSSSLLYTMHYDPANGPELLAAEARQWGRRFNSANGGAGGLLGHDFDGAAGNGSGGRRLRVGYVSPDFRDHTVPRFLTGALKHHDRAAFELFCYGDAGPGAADAVTATLQSLVPNWRDSFGQSDAALEAAIRADRIDILVDLRGHGALNRLAVFARRPAPVQVNMIGYFDTTGLAAMDWRITDERQDPTGQSEKFHTEQLARLPGGCWCYTPDEAFGGCSPPAHGPPALRNKRVTFGSLNKIVKISAPCAALWASVLQAVPGSTLLLPATSGPAAFIRERLMTAGMPADRLVIVGKARGRDGYLRRFDEIDISLDTFPFNGITTSCESLWMGVPVVSLAGSTTVSRAGRSILHSAGLGELAADTPEDYVRCAAALAGDVGRLEEMRRGMRARLATSGLMNQKRFAAELECAFRDMWRVRCAAPPGRPA